MCSSTSTCTSFLGDGGIIGARAGEQAIPGTLGCLMRRALRDGPLLALAKASCPAPVTIPVPAAREGDEEGSATAVVAVGDLVPAAPSNDASIISKNWPGSVDTFGFFPSAAAGFAAISAASCGFFASTWYSGAAPAGAATAPAPRFPGDTTPPFGVRSSSTSTWYLGAAPSWFRSRSPRRHFTKARSHRQHTNQKQQHRQAPTVAPAAIKRMRRMLVSAGVEIRWDAKNASLSRCFAA
mmetsp:Transcript_85862/g.195743  ORF Transcript_85862/g.195743 Transcript_85862/m.195743 type:complete len:239 (-) Transcript_85862:1128-1844(-)